MRRSRREAASSGEVEEEAEGGTRGREGPSGEMESGRDVDWEESKTSSSFSAAKRAKGVASSTMRRASALKSGC